MTRFDWILFDADETLFDFDAYAGLRLLFADYGVDFSAADYAEYQALNLPLWTRYQAGEINARTLQTVRFQRWAERVGEAPERLNERFLQCMATICQPLPGVRELLATVAGRYRLGIITNGFTELQQRRLRHTGLETHFEFMVISEELGVAKPDPAIFEHALARMGAPARDRVLMVGDKLESDVLGGLNAGLQTCWFNAHSKVAHPEIRAHHEIAHMSELPRILEAQGASLPSNRV